MAKKFETVKGLKSHIRDLDSAEYRDLFSGPDKIEDLQSIWNINQNRMSSIVSQGYSLVQHQEAFGMVADHLEDYKVYGQLNNYHDVVTLNVFFPDIHLNDDAQGLDLGIKVVNSYDKSSSFKIFGVANRLVCTNGMYMRTIIPGMEFMKIHVGELSTHMDGIISGFFEILENSVHEVQEVIDASMVETIEFENLDQVQATFSQELKSPMHAKNLMNGNHYEPENELRPTKWDFVNAITSYLTHSDKPVVESRVDIYSDWAEKILSPGYEIVPFVEAVEA